MNTLPILTCPQYHCDGITDWQPFVDALPCICWGILALITVYLLLRFIFAPLISYCHERKTNNKAREHELTMMRDAGIKKVKSDEQEAQLNLRIKEFESIELTKKILEKINTGDDLKTIKESFDALKEDFESLKNNLRTNAITLNLKQKR